MMEMSNACPRVWKFDPKVTPVERGIDLERLRRTATSACRGLNRSVMRVRQNASLGPARDEIRLERLHLIEIMAKGLRGLVALSAFFGFSSRRQSSVHQLKQELAMYELTQNQALEVGGGAKSPYAEPPLPPLGDITDPQWLRDRRERIVRYPDPPMKIPSF